MPSSDEASRIFEAIVSDETCDPLEVLRARGLPPELHVRVEGLIRAYERANRLFDALVDQEGAIDRALDAVEAQPRAEVSSVVPEAIGGYRIERALGVGARTAVLLAEQVAPIRRHVAVKLIFADATDSAVARIVENERQTLAMLEHASIARLYDFGIDGCSRPYLVLEYIRGEDIATWCRSRRPSPAERLRLFREVCAAMRFAHGRGVLHCDLKPENVLIHEIDGVAHAKVIDFGISRVLRHGAPIAELPKAFGTLRSVSPEALEPTGARLDARTDVFALGLLLHEIASDRSPRNVETDDIGEAIRRVVEDPIPPLRQHAPSASEDLEAVVAKALRRDPAERYQSVDALLADVDALLLGIEVGARPRGLLERVGSALRRRKLQVVAAATLLLVLALLVAERVRGQLAFDRLLAQAEVAVERTRAARLAAQPHAVRLEVAGDALGRTHAALLLGPDREASLALRATALEEAVLPRLERREHHSDETQTLVAELVAIRERLLERSREDPFRLERLSVALAYCTDTLRGSDRFAALQREQLAIDERLHRDHPGEKRFMDNLSWSYQRVADGEWSRGEPERALRYLVQADELGERLATRDAGDPVSLHTAQSAARTAGYERLLRMDAPGAIAAFARSRRHGEEILRRNPDHAAAAAMLVRTTLEQLESRWIVGDVDGAMQTLEATLARAGNRPSPADGEVDPVWPTADLMTSAASFAIEAGRVEDARRWFDRYVAECRRAGETGIAYPTFAGSELHAAVLGARLALLEGDEEPARKLLDELTAQCAGQTGEAEARARWMGRVVGLVLPLLFDIGRDPAAGDALGGRSRGFLAAFDAALAVLPGPERAQALGAAEAFALASLRRDGEGAREVLARARSGPDVGFAKAFEIRNWELKVARCLGPVERAPPP